MRATRGAPGQVGLPDPPGLARLLGVLGVLVPGMALLGLVGDFTMNALLDMILELVVGGVRGCALK